MMTRISVPPALRARPAPVRRWVSFLPVIESSKGPVCDEQQASSRDGRVPARDRPVLPSGDEGRIPLYIGPDALCPGSGDLVGDDLEEQIHQCMRNMKAVLAAAGMTMEDLIMVTVYTTEMQEFALLNKVYSCYFEPMAVYPSRAVLGISALPKAARVELTAIAKK
ncbi:MAG: hypothetical protein IPJ62_04205 [Betaproteobacteria bacterium]|nr:hypothetical protein [Betaproteobacteria bacterium]